MNATNLFQANLAALRKRHPAAAQAVEAAPSCAAQLDLAQRQAAEAHWLRCQNLGGQPYATLVVFGFGTGYHVEELVKGRRAEMIVVVEPDPASVRAAMSARDLTALLRHPRACFIVAGDLHGCTSQFLGAVDAIEYAARSKGLIVLPETRQRHAKLLNELVGWLRDLSEEQLLLRRTTQRLGPLVARHTLANAAAAVKAPGVKELLGAFPGKPALVCAAGPSLGQHLDDIRVIAPRVIMIAVDTAYQALARARVAPNIIVSVDPGERNRRFFAQPADPPPYLVAEPRIDPNIIQQFAGRLFVARRAMERSDNTVLEWLLEHCNDTGALDLQGTAATGAIDLALKMGCNPVLLVGQDLAFAPDGRRHPHGIDKAPDRPADQLLRTVHDANGNERLTDGALYAFKGYIERLVASSRARILNTSGGAKIAGTLDMPFADAAAQVPHEPFDPAPALRAAAARVPRVDTTRLAASAQAMAASLERVASACAQALVEASRIKAELPNVRPPGVRLRLRPSHQALAREAKAIDLVGPLLADLAIRTLEAAAPGPRENVWDSSDVTRHLEYFEAVHSAATEAAPLLCALAEQL